MDKPHRTEPSARLQALMTALAAARRQAQLTQRRLAQRLGRAHSFVAKIERGQRQLSVLELVELADGLGTDPRELFAEILKSLATVAPTPRDEQAGPG